MSGQLSLLGGEGPRMIAEGALLLPAFALAVDAELANDLAGVLAAAPFRHMKTPGGAPMSVATTSAGSVGWVTDRAGYRYVEEDPASGRPWPKMPASFERLSRAAAARASFGGFVADTVLVNRYAPGAKMGLHQDRDERDFGAPIVSVSLGLPATFQLGGLARSDRTVRVPLVHGDVVVWGGPARLRFHGVLPVRDGEHPLFGRFRVNLTFRRAR